MEDYILIVSIASTVLAVGLGFIPASIAKRKGYSFGLWWLYGWLVFIAAIIHVNFIPDKRAQNAPINAAQIPYSPPSYSVQSISDEIKKYKDLMDQGIITEYEFQAKREQLLKLI